MSNNDTMNVDLGESIKQWKALDLNARKWLDLISVGSRADEEVSAVQGMHNLSLCLINSIISEKVHHATQSLATPTSFSTTFQTTSIPLSESTVPRIESIVNGTMLSEDLVSVTSVTWYTAFSLLALIFTGLCLQDCGRVCGIRKDFSYLARSSPVFCLFDTLIIVLQLFYQALLKGPRSAIRYVASRREQHSFPPRAEQVMAAAGFMAILHIYSLFVTSGHPGTQLVIVCYLSSYWTNYVLNKYGKPQSELYEMKKEMPDEPDLGGSEEWGLSATWATIGQIAWWTISLRGALPENFDERFDEGLGLGLLCASALVIIIPPMLIYCTLSMILLFTDLLVVFAPAGITVYLCSLHPRSGWPSIIELTTSALGITQDTAIAGIGAILSLVWLLLHIFLYPFFILGIVGDATEAYIRTHSEYNYVRYYVDTFTPYGFILVLISMAAALSYLVARIVLFGRLADKLRLRRRSIASNGGWACLFLFAANIGSAWLYYTKVYGSTHSQR